MPTDNPNELQIIGAAYGLRQVTGKVIGLVNRTTTPQSLNVTANNATFDDNWPKNAKSLTVVYRYGNSGAPQVATAMQDQRINITGPGTVSAATEDDTSPPLTVWGASYGPRDVTSKVRGMISKANQSLSVTPNNATFTDTWPGIAKVFVIVASYSNQVPFVDIVIENVPYFLKYRPPLQIMSAFYGLRDVTAQLQSSVSRRTLVVVASNEVFGDGGWPTTKSLDVVYQYGDQRPQLAIARQYTTLTIEYNGSVSAYAPPVDANALNVITAAYGLNDVTAIVRRLIANQQLDFHAGNAIFGDGWPGNAKTFAMAYSWGPSSLTTLVVEENRRVAVAQSQSDWTQNMVTLEGLMANGDMLRIQTGVGLYWSVGPGRQILATAANLESGQQFTVGGVKTGQPGITLQSGDGTFVMLASDGTLHTGGTVQQAAVLVPSLLSTGAITLSLAGGAGAPFIAVGPNGVVLAASSYEADFASQFNLRLTATAAGTANHLFAYTGMSQADLELLDFDPLLAQVVWDLTGGWFLALGLGPLMNGSAVGQTGLVALLRSNARVAAAMDGLVTAVRNNPEVPLLPALYAFYRVVFDERLMLAIFRLIANQTKWWVVTYVATTMLVKFAIIPELGLAQMTTSFAIWAYNTANDIIAYVNSGKTTPLLEIRMARAGGAGQPGPGEAAGTGSAADDLRVLPT